VNVQKITSLTLLLSFIFLAVTSVVLYVVPEGRVAYWSDWRWLGLSKTQWGAVHINSGFLFLAAGFVHLWCNWRAVVAYLKNKARKLRIVTPAFTAALLLNLIVLTGTLLNLPPFSSILELGHSFKKAAASKYGEPPYGHAELSSLALFAKRTGLDLTGIKTGLTRSGIHFTGDDQTILAIAQVNQLTPKAVYDALRAGMVSKNNATEIAFPDQPVPGMGRMTLKVICTQYGLDQQQIVSALATSGIKAEPEQSLQEIAGEHNTDPNIIFGLIHEASKRN
jgi:hypothetical protein